MARGIIGGVLIALLVFNYFDEKNISIPLENRLKRIDDYHYVVDRGTYVTTVEVILIERPVALSAVTVTGK